MWHVAVESTHTRSLRSQEEGRWLLGPGARGEGLVFGGDGAAVRGGRNPGDGGRVGCTAGKRASKCATRSILRYVDFAAIRKHGRLSVRQVRFDRRATHGAHRLVRRCPRPSRAAPPPPRQAWPAPRPRYGPARTLAGPCARGARERSFWSGFFPSA